MHSSLHIETMKVIVPFAFSRCIRSGGAAAATATEVYHREDRIGKLEKRDENPLLARGRRKPRGWQRATFRGMVPG